MREFDFDLFDDGEREDVEKAFAEGKIELGPQLVVGGEPIPSKFQILPSFELYRPMDKADMLEVDKAVFLNVAWLEEFCYDTEMNELDDVLERIEVKAFSFANPYSEHGTVWKAVYFFEKMIECLETHEELDKDFFKEQLKIFESYADLTCFTTNSKYGATQEAVDFFEEHMLASAKEKEKQKFWAEQTIRACDLMSEIDACAGFKAYYMCLDDMLGDHKCEALSDPVMPLFASPAAKLALAIAGNKTADEYRKGVVETAAKFGKIVVEYPFTENPEFGEMKAALKELIYAWRTFDAEHKTEVSLEKFLSDPEGLQSGALKPFADGLLKELYPGKPLPVASLTSLIVKRELY